MLIILKAKIRNLAREAREIRAREYHELRLSRTLRAQERLTRLGYSAQQRRRIINRAISRGAMILPTEFKRGGKKRRDVVAFAAFVMNLVGIGQTNLSSPPADWLIGHDTQQKSLHHYRTEPLRRQMRAAHLAYGFLRGVPYKKMEQKSYTPPPWLELEKVERQGANGIYHERVQVLNDPVELMALEFSGDEPQTIKQRLAQWKDEAGAWVHPEIVEKMAMRHALH